MLTELRNRNNISKLNDSLMQDFNPNNYIFHFKKINLVRSLDFIILSFSKYFNLSYILSIIMSQSSSSKFYKTPSSDVKAYYMNFNNKVYEIKHIFFREFNHSWIRIDDPDIPFLQYFSSIINPTQYHLAQVEFTLDFSGPNIHRLYNSLKSAYLLSYSSKSKQFKHIYKDTEYSNDLRKTQSKGLRLYKKRDAQGNIISARLEILCKRNKLKKMKINYLPDVIDISCDAVFRPLKFKKFNHDKFIKNFVNRLEKGNPECQQNILEVLANIEQLNKLKNVSTADKYAKSFISYSCYETSPFEIALKIQLAGKKFLNGGVTEIEPALLFDDGF